MPSERMSPCRSCGNCCHLETPLTLADIDRLARASDLPFHTFFQRFVDEEPAAESGLFRLCKRESGECSLLFDRLCRVYENRPMACRFYLCHLFGKQKTMPWRVSNVMPADPREMQFLTDATEITWRYLNEHGPHFVEPAFWQAIEELYHSVFPRIPDAGDSADRSCPMADAQILQVSLTLRDIERIRLHLSLNLEDFFRRYVAAKPSAKNFTPMLKQKGDCLFYQKERGCSIFPIRPQICQSQTRVDSPPSARPHAIYRFDSLPDELEYYSSWEVRQARQYVRRCGTNCSRKIFYDMLNTI